MHDAKAALARYNAFASRQLQRTCWADGGFERQWNYEKRDRWIKARREYLEQVLTAAVKIAPSKSD